MRIIFLIYFFTNTFNLVLSQVPVNCETARKKYLEKYPDVKANGADPWTHYTLYGKNEGRIWPICEDDLKLTDDEFYELTKDPEDETPTQKVANRYRDNPVNCELARKKYLEKYPDVKANGADPWTHYTLYGKNEGRIWPTCSEEKNNVEVRSTNSESKTKVDGNLNTEKTEINSNTPKQNQTKKPNDPGFEKLAIGTTWVKGEDASLEKTGVNTYKFIWRDSYGVNKINLTFVKKEIHEGWGIYYVTILEGKFLGEVKKIHLIGGMGAISKWPDLMMYDELGKLEKSWHLTQKMD